MRERSLIDIEKLPFVKVLIFAILGIVLARYLVLHSSTMIRIELQLICSFFLLVFSFLKLFDEVGFYRSIWFLGVLIWILISFYYLGTRNNPSSSFQHFMHYKGTWIVGVIKSEPLLKNDRAKFTMEILFIGNSQYVQKSHGKILVNVPILQDLPSDYLKYSNRVLVPCTWKTIAPPRNPNELDYQFHMYKSNIWHQLYLGENVGFKVYRQSKSSLMGWSLALREKMVQKFSLYIKDPVALAVASTLILGYRADLDPEVLQIFSITGTIHILSVSGMHVVLVFMMFDKLLWWVRGRKSLVVTRVLVLVGAIWFYSLISGLSPSVLRASAMLTFVLIGKGLKRNGSIYNSLCVSAFFILCFSPKLIWDLGFQLSYLAVFFIVFCQDMWSKIWKPSRRWIQTVWSYSGMSISAQIGSGPLAVYYFKQFPIYFLLANLAIVLPSTAIMYLGFLLLICPSHGISIWIGKLLQFMIELMNYILSVVAVLPNSSLTFRNLGIVEIFLIYAILLLAIAGILQKVFTTLKLILFSLMVLALLMFQEVQSRIIKRKIVIHNVGNNFAITYASLENVYVFTDLKDEQGSNLSYRVMPYIRNIVQKRAIHLVESNKQFLKNDLVVRKNLFWLPDFRLEVWDRSRNLISTDGQVEILVFRQNLIKGIEGVIKNKKVKVLILDPSNSKYTIEKVQEWCEQYGQEYYVLKDNFAYFWDLRDHQSCNQLKF